MSTDEPLYAPMTVDVARAVESVHTQNRHGMIAEDPLTLDLMLVAKRLAETESVASVMISGESGSGKEVFARYIHQTSGRSGGPFVAINCAAIPETMLESILFGFEKGAFTGAYRSRAGKFEQADGGTLLLDEVSEMDIGLQAKLLRVLQEKEVDRLGGDTEIPVDVRIIATTNRDLRAAVTANQFRKDLYYRLNVLPLHLPPLRERPADIVPLARYFLQTLCDEEIPRFDASAVESLVAHRWPGNVRELENVVQRALIMRRGPVVTAADLQFDPSDDSEEIIEGSASGNLEDDLKLREQRLIVEAIRASNGNRQNAARRLGISPRTLRHKVARYKTDTNVLPALARL